MLCKMADKPLLFQSQERVDIFMFYQHLPHRSLAEKKPVSVAELFQIPVHHAAVFLIFGDHHRHTLVPADQHAGNSIVILHHKHSPSCGLRAAIQLEINAVIPLHQIYQIDYVIPVVQLISLHIHYHSVVNVLIPLSLGHMLILFFVDLELVFPLHSKYIQSRHYVQGVHPPQNRMAHLSYILGQLHLRIKKGLRSHVHPCVVLELPHIEIFSLQIIQDSQFQILRIVHLVVLHQFLRSLLAASFHNALTDPF